MNALKIAATGMSAQQTRTTHGAPNLPICITSR